MGKPAKSAHSDSRKILNAERYNILKFVILGILTIGGTPGISPSLASIQNHGVSILPDDPYSFQGAAGPQATVIPQVVTGQSFNRAYRVTVAAPTSYLGDASLHWETSQSINPRDNLQISFHIRKTGQSDENGIRASISFESGSISEDRSLDSIIPCNSQSWMPYRFNFKALNYHPAGEARIVLRFGYGPQAFEIGGIQAINLGADQQLPTFGIPVVSTDVLNDYGAYFDSGIGGSLSIIDVSNQPFDKAFRISTNGTSDFIYRSGLTLNNTQAVIEGELILLEFYARKLEPIDDGPIKAQVTFERNGGNYEKSLSINFPNDTDQWRLYQIPFRSRTDFLPGEAHLIFHFGYGPQKFEIADIKLRKYGLETHPDQLPRSFYYPGRGELGAQWRREAADRIEQHRKGDLSIIVRDRNGAPLPGATVRVNQRSHAFRFGSAVTAQLLAGEGETAIEREIYRSRVISLFNTTVLENDLKWPFWEDWAAWNRQATFDALNWLKANNLPVRGHTLIWPSYGHMPKDTHNLSPPALRSRIDQHFADILGPKSAGGRCYQWDVINEPFHNYEIQGRIPGINGVEESQGLLGNQEMVRWFQTARSIDGATKLFLNDFDILAGGGYEKTHQDYLYALAEWLLANGAPVDGIGFQGHVSSFTTPADMQRTIERFAALPLQFAVTEFDVNTLDEDLQADYLRDFLTLVFSYPKFTDFLQWGFWEKSHWIPQAALYQQDWSSKPIALAYTDLIYRRWWTDHSGQTDARGKLNVRGFQGEYRITATWLRETTGATVRLGQNSEIVIELDVDAPRPSIRRNR